MNGLVWLAAGIGCIVAVLAAWRALRLRRRLTVMDGAIRHLLGIPARADLVDGAGVVVQQTEQYRAVLDAENSRLRTILSALDDAVIVVGSHQEILSVNDAALALFPGSLAGVRGRTVIEMTGDHEVAELVRICLATGERQERTIDVSGSGRIVRAVAVPAGSASGDVLLIGRDVTQVQHLQAVRRELVANVSHELRTPLASIKLYVETLLDGGLEVPGMAEDRLNKINREVDELTQLVRELLELARLESGREQPNLIALDAAEIGRSAVERLQAQAERAGIALSAVFPDDLPPILGDRRMLEGALVNLIHNAVKFTPGGGSVTVGANLEPGDRVSLWVEDTGVGIPAEHLPRLFERFFKEDPARSGGGTGLGLAIVKHVALVHGGTVAVSSEQGIGSRFRIVIPCEPVEFIPSDSQATPIYHARS